MLQPFLLARPRLGRRDLRSTDPVTVSLVFLLKLGQDLSARIGAVEDDKGEQGNAQPGNVKVITVLRALPVGQVVVDS